MAAPKEGVELCPFDTRQLLERAANGALSDARRAAPLPRIRASCSGDTTTRGRVPCQILAAFAWAASGWRHFCADGCGAGEGGLTLVGWGCRFGLVQFPESEAGGEVDVERVIGEPAYNAGAGARKLALAWERTPCVGAENPDVAEHWYFATWYAGGWNYANNPNNPAYPVLRPRYGEPGLPGSFDRGSYPFQEVVFGLAENPPFVEDQQAWDPSPLSLPSTANICGTQGCSPGDILAPSVVHGRDCPPYNPTADDGGVLDAGTDDGGGGTGDGGVEPDPKPTGCTCSIPSERPRSIAWAMIAVSLGVLRLRRRSLRRGA